MAHNEEITSQSHPLGVQRTEHIAASSALAEDPFVRESPLTSLDNCITPTERFYVRNHFSKVPELEIPSWRLQVDGLVNHPLELNFNDILDLPNRETLITLECAGNSRSYLTPPAEGIAFGHGAVSTAKWKGASLATVLEKAGMKGTAVEVVFYGADSGPEEEDGGIFATDLPFSRSLPMATALHPDTLLAYKMNGEPLTPNHGFPLRLVVPRWYGMASVKWLIHIQIVGKPYEGFFQKRRYVFINEGVENTSERKPVTTLRVKTLITRPRHGEVIQQGPFTIRGFAWSGDGNLTKIEISTDGGRRWQEASLVGEPNPNCWQEWEIPWKASDPGHFIFMASATDSAGNRQPKIVPWNFRGYANNSIHTLAVEVSASRPNPSG